MRLAMPQLGESVTEGTIIRWLKSAGEHIGLDEPLVEIETEKVNVEVPSPWEGTLTEILVPEGETVSVGTALADIDEGTSSELQAPSSAAAGTGPSPSFPARAGSEGRGAVGPARTQSSVLSPQSSSRTQSSPSSSNGAQARYSPAVLRLAQEHHLDLRTISGRGLGGRVTRKDVMDFLEDQDTAPDEVAAEQPALAAIQESAETPAQAGRPPLDLTPRPPSLERKGETGEQQAAAGTDRVSAPAAGIPAEGVGARFIAPAAQTTPAGPPMPSTPTTPAASAPAASPTPPLAASPTPAPAPAPAPPLAADEEIIRPSPTRRAIAKHMVRSVQTSPHAWMVVEIDLTRLVRLRESVKISFREREGVDLSYLPFMIKATVLALKENPRLNASWREGEIVLKRRINIGIAVNTPEGLMVPVIHDADNYSIAGLARVAADLAARARSRRLKLEEVQGGTFTVDNTGVFGSIVSAPIINQPQAAILTMEAILKRPVVIDDAIAVRSLMNSCISFDHRVVDGGDVGPFMQLLKRHLESFGDGTALY
jgi:2-oxoisovalerate dehydrogenase E2 component (dihydrolipoyl transacylase)